MTEHVKLQEQTRRNLDGMDLERSGQLERAVALYEQNVAEGFEGDWPYGRLVAYYERAGQLDEAERVLERAIEVFKSSRRRNPQDRRSALSAFRGRLRQLRKATRQRG